MRSAVVLFAGSAALGAALLAGSAVFESRMERDYLHHSDRLAEPVAATWQWMRKRRSSGIIYRVSRNWIKVPGCWAKNTG